MPVTESGWFIWIVLPLLIFMARILDVSIGTMRLLFVVRGSKMIAAFLGFCEVFLWIVVISQIMRENTGLYHYVAYAAGFAAGNVVGITIEARLAYGMQTIRIITGESTRDLEKDLMQAGFGATLLTGEGLKGGTRAILYSTLPRQKVPEVIALIERHLPKAFISVEDVRTIRQGFFPADNNYNRLTRIFSSFQKGK